MPFYAEHQAFVDSNYTFRPNQSNVVTENNPVGGGATYASYPYGGGTLKPAPAQEEGLLDQNLMMLPTPPSV